MTSREKVLNVYPDAWRGLTGVFIPGHGEEDAIRIGRSWKSIASKLPPGSPAEETASEEFPKCPHCGGDAPRGFHIDCEESVAVPEPVPTEGLGDEAGCADIGYDGFFSRDIVAQSAAPIAPAAEDRKEGEAKNGN